MDTPRTAALAAAVALLLAGCGAPDGGGSGGDGGGSGASATGGEAVTVEDAWVKAATEEDGMTGVFGELVNGSGAEAAVTAASSPAAGRVELHEVAPDEGGNPVMREKEGGFPVPSDGSHPLEPGADHIMLMDLREDLRPGDEITVELEFAGGSTAEFTAPVKEYEGAEEDYGGDADGEGHESHGDDEDHGGDGEEEHGGESGRGGDGDH
ncbi:copper chaperone PCu(A)C [Nocardiopsis potens]|uniref:copper chaperone PCu(A)C n=1 Tax=Nocardiopsis potens TaxID=1246458 RepID=UPI000349E3E1|nr:copper chaperone PCu(A)C [Nocardiopsis potens]